VYQLLSHGRWFSPGTPASATTKTGLHDIPEILLKVALKHQKSINQIKYYKALGRRKTKQNKTVQYNICWTRLCANKNNNVNKT
jgi:hypothetical protein